jgi:hypothetical protein
MRDPSPGPMHVIYWSRAVAIALERSLLLSSGRPSIAGTVAVEVERPSNGRSGVSRWLLVNRRG